MKKHIMLSLICLFMANVVCYAQIIDYAQLEVFYDYEMVPNRAELQSKHMDETILLIGKKYTAYYSYINYIHDSLVEANPVEYSSQFATPDGKIVTPRPGETPAQLQARGGTTIIPARSKPDMNSYNLDHYFINRTLGGVLCLSTVVNIQPVKLYYCSYTEILEKPVWDIKGDVGPVANYRQKSTTNYSGGRNSTVEKPAWNMKADVDTIANYRCQKATTHYGGRNWTVWFTPDIPVSEGPWKLRGLPGLILKAETADGEFSLTATSVNRSANRPIQKDDKRIYRNMSKKDMFKMIREGNINPYRLIEFNFIEILK